MNELQKLLIESNVACAAEIGPKGMCEMRAIAGAQKNADAPIGVIVTENGKAYFCQVGGKKRDKMKIGTVKPIRIRKKLVEFTYGKCPSSISIFRIRNLEKKIIARNCI